VVYVFGERFDGIIRDVTPTHLTKDVVHQLQIADDIVNEILYRNDLITKLSQVPVILFPIHFGIHGNRSIAIRTFLTTGIFFLKY
jgi:GMP synthase (glutamine-hydrolysing)